MPDCPLARGILLELTSNSIAGAEVENHAEAVRELYEREHMAMVRLAVLIVGVPAIAEEVVHDAFVSILERPRGVDNLGAYLRRSVVNGCTSSGRRSTMARTKLRVLADRDQHDAFSLPPEIDETWTALDSLKRDQRTALVLRYYADLTVDEVAASMEIRLGTAKSLIHRSLKALKKELEPDAVD